LSGDSEYVEYEMPLKNSNELLNFTRHPRNLTLWWLLGTKDKPAFYLAVLASPEGERREPSFSEVLREWDRYGLGHVEGGQAVVSYERLMTESSP
jgi:hypothetical protein